MVGVRQNNLIADIGYRIVVNSFHRTVRTYRHESRCLDSAMGQINEPGPCQAITITMGQPINILQLITSLHIFLLSPI